MVVTEYYCKACLLLNVYIYIYSFSQIIDACAGVVDKCRLWYVMYLMIFMLDEVMLYYHSRSSHSFFDDVSIFAFDSPLTPASLIRSPTIDFIYVSDYMLVPLRPLLIKHHPPVLRIDIDG